MASQWHYKRGDEQRGPFTSTQLKELSASGQLMASDLVWKEGMADWLPASRLKGLFPGNVDAMPPTVAPVAAVPAVGSAPAISQPVAAKALPPPIPPRTKSAPPPLPPKAQPLSVQSASLGGNNPLDSLAGACATVRDFAGSAAAKARQVNAAIPNRITVGKFTLPKKVAIGAVVALLLVAVAVAFRHKSKSGTNSSVATAPKSFREEIAGEWIETTGDGTIQIKEDGVILGGMGLTGAKMFPCQTDDAKHTITFKVDDTIWTAKLDDDNRLYAHQQGNNSVIAFAREYKGGWSIPGSIDRGNRLPGMAEYDRKNNEDKLAAIDPKTLQNQSIAQICQTLGQPTEVHPYPPPHANTCMYAWKTGDDEYIAALEIKCLDGSMPDIVEVIQRKISMAQVSRSENSIGDIENGGN